MALKTGEEIPLGIRLVFLVVFFSANRYEELADLLVQRLRSHLSIRLVLPFKTGNSWNRATSCFFFLVFFVFHEAKSIVFFRLSWGKVHSFFSSNGAKS